MDHYLHFGAGPNQLPEPWQNLNAEHDIRKRLKFDEGSAVAILAEHVIEHVSWNAGFMFLAECFRVLKPGGVLRVGFPDLSRFLTEGGGGTAVAGERVMWNQLMRRYAEALHKLPGGEPVRQVQSDEERCRAAALLLQAGWLHQCAWTWHTLAGALLTHGFKQVKRFEYGKGGGIFPVPDGHHKQVGQEVAELETSVIEAIK
jgi:hypothetical protein